MKKLLCSLLALVTVLSLAFSGGLAEDKPTLSVFVGTETYTPEDINTIQVIAKAEQATGIHINWVSVPGSSYNDKLGTILATDDLPDIIFGGVSTSQLVQYGDAGSFIEMENLIRPDLMPNLCALIEKRPDLLQFVTAPDGHVYGLPRATEGLWNQVERIYSINTTWLEKLNLEMPTTLADFKAMLIAFRDLDPNGNGLKDEVPFTFAGSSFSVANFEYIFSAYGMGVGKCLLDVVDGKVVCVAQDERFADAIRYIADLYSENLIDPDAFMMDGNQWKAKISNEQTLVGVSPNWDHNDNISNPAVLAQYDFMKPLRGDNGEDPVIYSPAMYGLARGFGVITKECKDPELAAKWLDYWFDCINSIEASEGCIGERQYYDENGSILTGNPDTSIVAELKPRAQCALNPYTCRALLKEYYDSRLVAIPSTFPKIDFLNEYVLPYADKDPFNTKLYYNLEESETISMLETPIRDYINSKCAEWITKGTIDAEWDSFQKTLKDMKIDKYLEVQQAAYNRMYGLDK